MIRGIILDVDGVLVGDKIGYNSPLPHRDVLKVLQKLRSEGLIVSLCTGKGSFALKQIVREAGLDNLHIGDGGAVTLDVLNQKNVVVHTLPRNLAKDIIVKLKSANIYIELYTTDSYYIESNQVSEMTKKHTTILHQSPIIVEKLENIATNYDLVKIMPVAKDLAQKKVVVSLFHPWSQLLTLQWGVHPAAYPSQFGVITQLNISKQSAVLMLSSYYKIPLTQFLGVGDTMMDWEFMKICGYAGVMGNASNELKSTILSHPAGFIGNHIDENGVLAIFSHFGLMW